MKHSNLRPEEKIVFKSICFQTDRKQQNCYLFIKNPKIILKFVKALGKSMSTTNDWKTTEIQVVVLPCPFQ